MQWLLNFCLAAIAAGQLLPVTPANGSLDEMPALGLGTWYMRGTNATEAIASAIVDGYRLIDAAYIYMNQKQVGAGIKEGIRRAGITRQDVWVTSKLWNNKHADAAAGLEEVLGQLGLDYVDLFLIHWPMNGRNQFDHVNTWKQMEQLPATGFTRFIGISNFSPKQVDEVLQIATIRPKVHQIELHPYLPQTEFVESLQRQNITVNAYAPLANTNAAYSTRTTKIFRHSTISQIARAKGCTPAQVLLAWGMRRNTVPIPKAVVPAHWKENLAAAEACKLTDTEDAQINSISSVGAFRFNGNVCSAAGMLCWEGLARG